MASLIGYINLLLVLIQPAPVNREPVFDAPAILSSRVEWIIDASENTATFLPLPTPPKRPEAVTHNNKALPASGEVLLTRFSEDKHISSKDLCNKAKHAVKLFILFCQLKSDLSVYNFTNTDFSTFKI